MGRHHYVFPQWSNVLLPALCVTGLIAPLYAVFIVAYGFSPRTTDVGYEPVQPMEFSHEMHAGQLGLDCRYCHNTVEHAAKAAVPPTQTCFNCHTQIHKDSPKLTEAKWGPSLWESYETGMPVEWIRVHDLPDYAYFNHAAHVTRGVGCVECHGRIDRMEVVYQHETLSMGWCLDCHRDPETFLRDPALVTDLAWGVDRDDAQRRAEGRRWLELNNIDPSQRCSTCHR
jgi:hypothetical protein